MTTYRFTLNIGYAGADKEEKVTVEDLGYSEEEWAALSSDEKEKILDDYAQEWSDNYIDLGWREIEE